jgi:thiosulfate/3-mercaptopyruvate sulfurtransferase
MSKKIIYTPGEVRQMQIDTDSIIVIDVRDKEDFAKAHIPGAINMPEMFTTLSMTDDAGLQEMEAVLVPLIRQAGITHEKTVIIYEDSLNTRYGGSCRGYFQLTLFGHQDVGILDGGLSQWQLEGLPVTSDYVEPTPSNFQVRLERSFFATLDDVKKAIYTGDVKLLDNRDEDEWRGISSSPYGVDFAPRKGRIPGSRWVEWYNFMESQDGISHFKSPESIRAICAQVGLYTNDDIIIYCFKGARASNTYIALKMAGFKNLRNYYGSWNEWSRDPELPIDSRVLAA